MQCIKAGSENILTLSDGRAVTLLDNLGGGRFGTVHRAYVESGWGIRRPAAVKRLRLAADWDHGDAMRALGEIARRLVCIRHPAVIQLYEVDRTDRLHAEPFAPFLVHELVEGESLQSLLVSWQQHLARPPMDFALVVTLRVAEALGAALFTETPDGSLTGLIHGDLSPRQVIISNQGEVKVGDFGQFTLGEGHSHVRRRPLLAHTAPEVMWGNTPDARSDVFSLGALLREMLIAPRFRPETDTKDAIRMIRDGLFHSSALEPNVPRGLSGVIDRALHPNPAARYGHARSFAFDLRREMLLLGLTDAHTCVRHAIVGWCEAAPATERDGAANTFIVDDDSDDLEVASLESEPAPPPRQHSDVAPRSESGLEDLEDDLPEFLFGSSPPSTR